MREYLLVLVVAAATTYLLVGLAGRVARLVGAVPVVRARDVHVTPIPRLGGIAMLGGFLAAMLVASQLPRLQGVFVEYTDAQALMTGAIVICLIGAADDVWGLDSLTKFAGQVLAAGLVTAQGVQLYWLPLGGGTLSFGPAQGVLLTVFLIVLTVNAVNFVDGLDGLAAGTVGIGAAAFFSYSYFLSVEQGLSRMTTPTLISAVLAGLCLGFLPHNVHPARIFMGDSGSMLIGLLLATGSISLTARFPPGAIPSSSGLGILLPLLLPFTVLAVPFLDLLAAIVRRTRAGRSPFAPDKQHLHHQLLEIGHSHRRAVFVMWVWSGLVAFGFVVAALRGSWPTYAALGAVLLLAVGATLRRPAFLTRRTARSAGA